MTTSKDWWAWRKESCLERHLRVYIHLTYHAYLLALSHSSQSLSLEYSFYSSFAYSFLFLISHDHCMDAKDVEVRRESSLRICACLYSFVSVYVGERRIETERQRKMEGIQWISDGGMNVHQKREAIVLESFSLPVTHETVCRLLGLVIGHQADATNFFSTQEALFEKRGSSKDRHWSHRGFLSTSSFCQFKCPSYTMSPVHILYPFLIIDYVWLLTSFFFSAHLIPAITLTRKYAKRRSQ